MLFASPTGAPVRVESEARKRRRPPLDESLTQFARAETFERYIRLGFTIERIATIFRLSVRTIKYDLKHLEDERLRRAAEGKDPLPMLGT